MMYQETKFRYGRFTDDKVQVLELPYRGDDITMVLILPLKGTPLSEVGNRCSPSPRYTSDRHRVISTAL